MIEKEEESGSSGLSLYQRRDTREYILIQSRRFRTAVMFGRDASRYEPDLVSLLAPVVYESETDDDRDIEACDSFESARLCVDKSAVSTWIIYPSA